MELLLTFGRHIHTRTAGRAELHGERRLKNLFEQFALEDARGRSNAKTFALLKKCNLIGVLAGEIQFVGDDDDRVAVGSRKPPQRLEKIDLRADIEVQGGLIQKQKQRLLCEGTRQNDALFFAAGDLIHPAVAEMLGANLRKRIARDDDVLLGFEPQRAAVRMPPLENKFPGARGKEQGAFLLDHGDTLSANAMGKSMGHEAVQQHASGKGCECARNQL
jgi:hypothetical protein